METIYEDFEKAYREVHGFEGEMERNAAGVAYLQPEIQTQFLIYKKAVVNTLAQPTN